MSIPLERGYVVPNPGPVKTIGILNIVFASLILLMGLCSVGSQLVMPSIRAWMEVQQQKTKATAKQQQKDAIDAQIAELQAKIKEANSAEEKATLEAEIAALRARPEPFTPNTMIGLEMTDDPKYKLFIYGDLVTSLLLNVPMLIAGIGLLRLREWARKTSLWIAVLKLIRLTVMGIFCVVVIVPWMTRRMTNEFDKMGAQIQAQQGNRRGGPPVRQTLRTAGAFMGAAMTAGYVGSYLFYAIYPTVSLIVLTRPRARAACIAAKPASAPEAEML